LRRVGIWCAVALLAAGVAANAVHAQTTDKATARAQHVKKQKSGEKKPVAQSQSEPKSSGMSGYRPDPVTGY